jgi:outer membrane receptor protein involved in Fe transport
VTATIGGRATYSQLSGQTLGLDGDEFEPDREEFRFLPTAAMAWQLRPHLLAFVRYQEGFRAGGLSIAQTATAPIVTRFGADRIATIEAGVRFGRQESDRFSGSATLSYARWRDIQADLIEPSSLPSTMNIGNGRIYGFEASARWRPVASLTADVSIFLNDSGLAVPAAGFEDADVDKLPNIAPAGASAGLSWSRKLSEDVILKADALARYVGASRLGVSPGLELSQGDYVETGLSLRLNRGDLGVGLDVTNAGDLRGNRFSLGNPFAPPGDRQITPLRPLTVRLGLSRKF